jgi:hypothetical protein
MENNNYFANNQAVILHCLTDEQLENLVSQTINKIEATKEHANNEPCDLLLTAKMAAERLNCHPSTLWHWTKRGLLHPVKVGGRTGYELKEVNEILKGKRL